MSLALCPPAPPQSDGPWNQGVLFNSLMEWNCLSPPGNHPKIIIIHFTFLCEWKLPHPNFDFSTLMIPLKLAEFLWNLKKKWSLPHLTFHGHFWCYNKHGCLFQKIWMPSFTKKLGILQYIGKIHHGFSFTKSGQNSMKKQC